MAFEQYIPHRTKSGRKPMLQTNGHHFTKVIHGKGVSSCIHCSMTKDEYVGGGASKLCQRQKPQTPMSSTYPEVQYKPKSIPKYATDGRNCKVKGCTYHQKHTHGTYGQVMLL